MQFDHLRRRDFIVLLGGGAAAWPLAARAQQGGLARRVGMLMNLEADDPEAKARMTLFSAALQELGWVAGRNLLLDYRWGINVPDRMRRDATELIALAPDVVVTSTGTGVAALQQASRTVPIVFTGIIDAVAEGRVESLARPGGNATGFMSVEYGTSGKLLELLKEIAPDVKRAAVVRDPTSPGGIGQYEPLQAAAPSFGVALASVDVRNPGEIESGIADFARYPNGGLIVPRNALANFHRERIVAAAARHRLPAVYPGREFAMSGGLISYGGVTSEQWRGTAGYVDRILKGAKPADLPVQTPTRYELIINLKTAKVLGITVPLTLLARADEVIE
jgi:ABC-type uncharacterized transport system substrate-binding protein